MAKNSKEKKRKKFVLINILQYLDIPFLLHSFFLCLHSCNMHNNTRTNKKFLKRGICKQFSHCLNINHVKNSNNNIVVAVTATMRDSRIYECSLLVEKSMGAGAQRRICM
jgi:hypothetical protein